jgi:hypothetical protein
MKRSHFYYTLIVLALVIFLLPEVTLAQCAMCKATVNENVVTGKGKGQGLNTGILYLMAFPYIIGGVIAYYYYKAYKKKKMAS